MTSTLHTEDQMSSAWRVVSAIGTIKWVLVVLYGFAIVVTLVATLTDSAGGSTMLNVTLFGALSAAVTWVLFGFAQHTLGMLILIARNTGRR